MKKLFYKIEMRMERIFKDKETGKLTREKTYYSNGYCIIEEGKIKDYLKIVFYFYVINFIFIPIQLLLVV